ncbi:MAG: winged helix DNA-binding protein [Elusimicrobia bacterium]|nr:winged helix DNA-binding protein [Elusimicrobiota bacterium]
MKTLEIKIKSPEEGYKDVIQTYKNVQARKKIKPRMGTYFSSLEAVRNLPTEKRLELLHVIREKKPKSIRELSHITDRDFKNVHEDIQILKSYGLVKMPRKRKKIKSHFSDYVSVPYQNIAIYAGI